MSHRIVFVEDDADLANLISSFLSRHDMDVVIEPRGEQAVETILREAPDIVLLDIMLPGKDGLSICRELRPQFDGIIIMLTSLDSDINQILGLELGANDYILKTTPPSVLVARLRAQLRHLKPLPLSEKTTDSKHASHKVIFGQLTIDPINRDVTLANEKIPLSTSDFDLLWLLASHAGETLHRDILLKEMRGVNYDGLDRSIDVAISRLRKKLGDNPNEPFRIKTVRNRGYLFSLSGWN
ncbi:two-component system response regulator RstA [Neisseriaceae bacterium TC5R-5]|nr:two-component system response regulator RstA [Neisseriaceae bacterium TC5R-5]